MVLPRGQKGDTGPANELTIGSVSSGTTSQATITGNPPHQALNLVLQKGEKGDKGERGKGISSIEYLYKTTTTQSKPNAADVQSTSIPTMSSTNKYLWQKQTINYTEGSPLVTVDLIAVYGDKGDKGDAGATGNGISSITKTGTSELVDTYTITYTNGQSTTFTVTNGEDGKDGKDGEDGNVQDVQVDGTSVVDNHVANIVGLTDWIYNALPKVTGTGESATLNNTVGKAPLKSNLKGNTYQYSTSGKNLLNFELPYSVSGEQNKWITPAPQLEVGQNYYFVGKCSDGTKLMAGNSVFIWYNSISAQAVKILNANVTYTAEDLSSANSFYIYLGANLAGKTITECMLVKGTYDSSNIPAYEPYTGGIPAPNPDFPEPMHVVSGDNSIEICGKNLFNPTNYVNCYCNDSEQKFVSDSSSIIVYAKAKPNTKYTFVKIADNRFSGGASPNEPIATGSYTASTRLANNTGTELTITTSANDNYVWAWVYQGNASPSHTEQETLNSIMIVEGETAPTTYESYQSQTYPINLPEGMELCKIGTYQDKIDKSTGKNLLPPNIQTQTLNTLTITNNNDGTYTLNGTATANTNFIFDNDKWIDFEAGTYYVSCNTYTNITLAGYYDIGTNCFWRTSNGAFTLNNDVSQFRLVVVVPSGAQFNNVVIMPMINKGSTAQEYEPYGTGWYLKKEIGKVVLNGSETWGGNANGFYHQENTLKRVQNYTDYIMCTNLQIATQNSGMGYGKITGYYSSIENYPGENWFYIRIENITSSSDLTTWLSNNNTTVYYVLATPTYTLIEGELLNQLEALYNARCYDNQTNLSQVNNDISFLLDMETIEKISS